MKKFAILVASMILLSSSLAFAKNKSTSGDKKAHPAADKNGDGKITREEARAHSDERFDRRDTNKDGVLDAKDKTKGRAAAHGGGKGPRHHRGMGKKFFEKADTNKDGKLSANEADAFGKVRFKKLDENKDGFLTKDELRHKKPQAK